MRMLRCILNCKQLKCGVASNEPEAANPKLHRHVAGVLNAQSSKSLIRVGRTYEAFKAKVYLVEKMCATTSPSSKSDGKNTGIFSLLKEIKTRLEKVEQNQIIIMKNQSVLSQGQAAIVSNEERIADKLHNIEANIVTKPEMHAQSKILMECKVVIKKVEKSVCRLTGETYDSISDEVSSMLPLQNLPAVIELERKLEESPGFTEAMTSHLYRIKGTSQDVSSLMRLIFTDELLAKYNWDGRWEKQALSKLFLVNNSLRGVFQQQGAFDFEKSVKKSIERSHHRLQQKKYLKKDKN